MENISSENFSTSEQQKQIYIKQYGRFSELQKWYSFIKGQYG